MPVDRHKSPPVTDYQKARRRWLDYTSWVTSRSAVEGTDHVRRVWLSLSVALTALCPRRGHRIRPGQVEETAQRLVRDHLSVCTICRDTDWTWITHLEEEE